MKQFYTTVFLILLTILNIKAQNDDFCATPNLDSAFAVSLPYYDNNELLENTLQQNGYYDLEEISFPTNPQSKSSNARSGGMFLETKYLIPLDIFIYRRDYDPATSITEAKARELVCGANKIFREADTGIQFYVNTISIDGDNIYNDELDSKLGANFMFASKRISNPSLSGINVHFIRYTMDELAPGMSTIPRYPNIPFTEYSLFVQTHYNPSGGFMGNVNVISTFVHELGHNIGLLHTHHPGRLLSMIFNESNGTISNGCYQESVQRDKKNRFFDGCLKTGGKLKSRINGDFLEDTEADGNLSGLVSIGTCTFTPPLGGDFREDNWEDVWKADTRNVMAYVPSSCRSNFSHQQKGVMWSEILHLKNHINYQQPNITMGGAICSTSSGVATLNNVPSETSVTWEIEPANLVVNGSGLGTIANIQAADAYAQGNATITYTLIGNGDCFMYRVKRAFWVGRPSSIGGAIIGPSVVNTGQAVNFTFTGGGGSGSYNWVLPYNSLSGPLLPTEGPCSDCWSIISGATSAGMTARVGTNNGYVQVRKNNSCGYSGTITKWVTIDSGSGGPCTSCPIANVFPSSATTELNIEFLPEEQKKVKDFDSEIQSESFKQNRIYQIHDFSGRVVYSNKSKSKHLRIDVSRFREKGIYVLRILHEGIGVKSYKFHVE